MAPDAADAPGRATAALAGLAIGDALGMPTQSLSRETIRADHGRITGFSAPGPHQRIARGLPAGSVTDDTEQAVLIAGLLVEGCGVLDPHRVATTLGEWEQRMAARGSLDLLGPSTKAAIERIRQGVPLDEAGSGGSTNGAAMRIAPVGIAEPCDDLDALVAAVHDACRVTHDTSAGIAGAAAVAAAVSAGVAGAGRAEALDVAIEAARRGARLGHRVDGADIAAKADWARGWLPTVATEERAAALADVIGTSVASQESVVAALALLALPVEPLDALLVAVEAGGDTDTVAAMAGAMLGAVHGRAAWPEPQVRMVERVNGLAFGPLAADLLALRSRRAAR